MNYPIQSIAIIAPILFIVIMVALPVIGTFGGWKRAAYWGGGNLVFYFIGLLIWNCTYDKIAGMVAGLLKKLIGQGGDANFNGIAASILAPIFFLAVMAVANLILLINYYAWFKKTVGLSKTKKVKKKGKNGKITKTKVPVVHNYSTKYKVMNYVVGGVGMTAAMIPSTFAFANATLALTTSYKTRAKNSFVNNFYNAMVGFNNGWGAASYYGPKTPTMTDTDALFAALAMNSDKVTLTFPSGDAEEKVQTEAFKQILDEGYGSIYISIAYPDASLIEQEEEQIKATIECLKKLISSWNAFVDAAKTPLEVLLKSDNATRILIDMVTSSDQLKDKPITPTIISERYEGDNSFFAHVQSYIKDNPLPEIKLVKAPQKSFNNMVEAMVNCYTFDPEIYTDLTSEQYIHDRQVFHDRTAILLGLLFSVQK